MWTCRRAGTSACLLAFILGAVLLAVSEAQKGVSAGRVLLRGLKERGFAERIAKEGSASKHLYCKLSGGCSQCQEDEEIERYCADTGFKELLQCTTNSEHATDWPVTLTYPYPPDVHIDADLDEAGSGASSGSDSEGGSSSSGGSGGSSSSSSSRGGHSGRHEFFRVVRSCTEKTVAAHQQALADEVAAADRGPHGRGQTGLFNFELVMVLLLGLALPVVYWRKIRIRHL